MGKLTRKTILGLLAMVLAVITLGTTTYAWITTGAVVTVQEFDLDVTSGDGLEIAYKHADGTTSTWGMNINNDILFSGLSADYQTDNFANNFRFTPVTSVDGRAFTTIQLTETEVPGEGIVSIPSLVPIANNKDVSSGIVEFTLIFRTKVAPDLTEEEPTPIPLKLIWNQLTLNSTLDASWSPERAYTDINGNIIAPNDPAQQYLAMYGARVSVAGNLFDEADPITRVYEKPSVGSSANNDAVNLVLSNNEPNWAQGAHDYYYQITGVDLEKYFGAAGESVADYRAAETQTTISNVHVADFGTTPDAAGYYYAEVVVRIYLEGFDSEMFNTILSNNLQTAFGFTYAKE